MNIDNIESIINREITITKYKLDKGKECSFKVDMNGDEKNVEVESMKMRNDLEKWGQFIPLKCIIWRRGKGIKLYPIIDMDNLNKKLLNHLIEMDEKKIKR